MIWIAHLENLRYSGATCVIFIWWIVTLKTLTLIMQWNPKVLHVIVIFIVLSKRNDPCRNLIVVTCIVAIYENEANFSCQSAEFRFPISEKLDIYSCSTLLCFCYSQKNIFSIITLIIIYHNSPLSFCRILMVFQYCDTHLKKYGRGWIKAIFSQRNLVILLIMDFFVLWHSLIP